MNDGRLPQAHGDSYRHATFFERVGNAVGRVLGDGPIRRGLRGAYRRLFSIVSGGGPQSVLPRGEVIRLAPEFRYVTWNPVEYEAFRAVLRRGDAALDIGANVGAYAVLFGLWVGPEGRVLAFEPAPASYRGLRQHLALNGLTGWVEALQAAASDRIGDAEFVSEGFQGTNRLQESGAPASPTQLVRVPTTTIDAECVRTGLHPRLIKIDVEGAEIAVLRGARETIARMDVSAGVFVEMHPAAWRAQGLSVDDMRAELAHQRLRPVPLRATGDPWALDGECMRLVRD